MYYRIRLLLMKKYIGRNVDDPLMKAILEYRLHPSIIAIKEKNVSQVSLLVSLKLSVMRS